MEYKSRAWQQLLRKKISRRAAIRGAALGSAGLTAAVALGCGEGEETTATPTATQATGTASPAAQQPQRGGVTVANLGNLTAILDPHTDINQMLFVWAIIGNGALDLDGATWKVMPALVEKWEIPGDGTEIVFKVRQGAKWHNRPPSNGREVTAEDIAFNLMRMSGKLDPQNIARYQRASTIAYLNRAEAVDKYTVRAILDKPNSGFIRGLGDVRNAMVPKDFAETVGFQDPLKFVGSGGFTLERWEDNGQRAEFKPNPGYWRKGPSGEQLPYIEGVRWNYLPDRATSMSTFIAKSTDWFSRPSKTERQTISSAFRDAKLEAWPGDFLQYMAFNTKAKPFDDPRVRKAIFLTVNFKEVSDSYEGEGFWDYTGPVGSVYPEGIPSADIAKMPGYNPATKQQDIEKAKALMAEAGYPDPDFSVKMLPPGPQPAGFFYETAVRLQDSLKKVWPNLKPELDLPPDGATFSRRLVQGDFQTVVYVYGGYADATIMLLTHYHSKGSRNYGKFNDAAIDQLIDSAVAELNTEKRASILKEIQTKLINDHIPYILFNQQKHQMYVNPRIKGLSQLLGSPGAFNGYIMQQYADRYWIAS